MKKLSVAIVVASLMSASTAFADTVATHVANWDATAIKKSKANLIVTPTNSLRFDYDVMNEGFNNQDGFFSVTIEGDATATDFMLEAKTVSNTLNGNGSTLEVTPQWNGVNITKDAYTLLMGNNGSATETGGGLSSLGWKATGASSAYESFNFIVAKATQAGVDTPFVDLNDGLWNGDVKVEFKATWN